jgi:hypothetical protein
MSKNKSWRDVYKVHPVADLFPMLPENELRKLGEDIKTNRLKEKIVLWTSSQVDDEPVYLLDGRNRLAAMDLVGMAPADSTWWANLHRPYHSAVTVDGKPVADIPDPYAYVISKNIHRRHLTKEQQADLIVKAMKLKEAGLAKVAKPVKPRNDKGQLQGQVTKDTFKAKVVEEAAKHGISKRTVENSLAKAKGPTQKAKTPSPETSQAPSPQGKQQEKRPLDTEQKISLSEIIKTLGQPKSKRQIENENRFLLGEVADLRSELVAVRSELLQAQMKQVENLFRVALRGTNMDLTQWRRYLAKKYHPDINSGKTFTAGEVMADINPLLKSLSGDGVSV